MATRATIIVDANVDPASREFRRLTTVTGDASRKMIAQTRAQITATTTLGRAWRRTGFEMTLAMSKMDRSFAGVGRRGRNVAGKAALVGGLGAVGIVSEVRKFSAADLEIANIVSGGRLNTPSGRLLAAQRKATLTDISRDPGIASSAAGLAQVWAKMLAEAGEEAVGDPEILRTVGRAATGFRAEPGAIGSLSASLLNVYGTSIEDLTGSLEILAQTGKAGGVEMRNMADKLGIVIPLAKQFGFTGSQGLADLGALFQVGNLQMKDPNITATAARQFFNRFSSPEMNRLLALARIPLFDAETGNRRRPRQIFGDIESFIGGAAGDPRGLKMAALFPDIRGRQMASALFGNMRRFDEISASAVAAEGTILGPDVASAMESSAFKLEKAASNMATSVLGFEKQVNTLSNVLLKASESPEATAAVLTGAAALYTVGPTALGIAGTAAILKRKAIRTAVEKGTAAMLLRGTATTGTGLLLGTGAAGPSALGALAPALGPLGVAATAASVINAIDPEAGGRIGTRLGVGEFVRGDEAKAITFRIDPRASVTVEREDDNVPSEELVDLE